MQRETSRGFLGALIPMYENSKPGSPLEIATHAVSLSAVANWPGRRHLGQRAGMIYGRAMRAVQSALQDPKQATSNETLLVILLFSLYEVSCLDWMLYLILGRLVRPPYQQGECPN